MPRTLFATAVSAMAAVTNLSAQEPAPYTFVGLPWGDSPVSVKETLTSKGYTFAKIDQDGDLVFDETVGHTPTTVGAVFDPARKLVKVEVAVATADADARRAYESIIEQLRTKYGKPDLVLKRFESPYAEGGGNEDQAIRHGKGHYSMCWSHGKEFHPGDEALCVIITQALAVNLHYESAGWHNESVRREAAKAKGAP